MAEARRPVQPKRQQRRPASRGREAYAARMADPFHENQTVGDALAQGVERRRGPGSSWAEALRELGALDRAVYEAVAVTETPHLDSAFRRLSIAANYSRLWLGMSAAMATIGGRQGRRVAREGVLAIGATSAPVNVGIQRLARRPSLFHRRLCSGGDDQHLC